MTTFELKLYVQSINLNFLTWHKELVHKVLSFNNKSLNISYHKILSFNPIINISPKVEFANLESDVKHLTLTKEQFNKRVECSTLSYKICFKDLWKVNGLYS